MALNRRQILQTALAGSVGVALVGLQRACMAQEDFGDDIRNPFLTDQQSAVISAVAGRIIPQTDTPGAIEAGVPEFIVLLLSDWYTPTERQPVVDGIETLSARCAERWNTAYPDCTADQQDELLASMQDSEFFKMMKQLTVYGYYSSETGANAELRFEPAPGRYETIDFADVGKQWVR